ncbi:MAG: sugar kinase [Candidatus Aenigmarchaeota archaeon CG_4_10_14_0_8_um_filter_37_24]|nr:sugar kinase [Candidatus Aenigmarchaeota archaeon]OIN88130.1 MAG: sugar kinase [Candidatus Aenigmarchaeota archaeon CG1_02_38_14]PIV69547.1 MAG: sugar kinase [Candidatus Aenigmarchaeota archaeon CG01_land_8_20_14_3_00_37_9]PIW41194.1 MAG: sugar kinase [Candidatus Aenigmarchaeota archaeon CG15_BIG_FIL_POST_REV_8_21_14_020_37_27]PIX50980.1 MAG: sugar kinase [Candidatus Aenigmarchaeota archaeon CG_4_8_14_3_um_filter_37_24]PIY34863.1 MAG: sugar kinase [Candidatus Aenigmarchaeota archaeon CG_4_1
MIISIGTIGLDTTRTPFKTVERVLGGAAVYSGLSASFFSKTGLVGVIGKDFPEKYYKTLKEKLDLSGVKVDKQGKTFFYDSTFDYGFTKRQANKTELNVIENFRPKLPETYRKADYVYLANNDPDQNLEALSQVIKPKLTVCDTIEYWILNKKKQVEKMMSCVDVVVLNDDEIRLLTKEPNLIKAAKKVLSLGTDYVVVKKGEHGSLLIFDDVVFPAPGYPMEDVVDPTGAGDSFAGGFLGHISRIGKLNEQTLKEAVIYGNVMGSFAVEDFSVNRFLRLKAEDIEERYQTYRNIVKF